MFSFLQSSEIRGRPPVKNAPSPGLDDIDDYGWMVDEMRDGDVEQVPATSERFKRGDHEVSNALVDEDDRHSYAENVSKMFYCF